MSRYLLEVAKFAANDQYFYFKIHSTLPVGIKGEEKPVFKIQKIDTFSR